MLDFTRLDIVRRQRPLIHCVSNIVTANDCANLALAVGASPMMAQAPEEMEAISAVSDATVLNTGTPDAEKCRACRICAVSARHPVVLDPVGVGASPWRLGQVRALLDLFTPSILRVNLGEARALLGSDGQEQGVDSPLPASREARRDTAMDLARRRGTAVLLSGPEDLVCSGHAHGGIVRLPGTDGLFSHDLDLFPSYTAGLYEENGSVLFVTRGLGNSGPSFRVFNRPEIAVLTLRRAEG